MNPTTCAALCLFYGAALASGSAQGADPAFIDSANVARAQPFDLSEVRLLDSVFKTNEDLDAKYLLSLDADRLLLNFRVTAGLPASAQPYGGWEDPKCGLRGHFVGHYLSACAEMFASTRDQRFLERGNYLIGELAKCQAALGTGYLSAFPASVFDTLETKQQGIWAPYYTIHKIMAGLLDQYHYCGNQQALSVACQLADYLRGRMAKLPPEQIEKILKTTGSGPQTEFGGMSEVLHNLSALTHRPDYLEFAHVFDRDYFLAPLASGQDRLDQLHANTHIPQVIGFARHFELTGDERYRRAADYFFTQVTQHHSYVTGSNSNNEHFLPPDVEANALSPATAETCNVYNMLKLSQHVFSWSADPAAADYYELALYNHILVSIDPADAMTTYFLSLQPGHFKLYGTPETAFWCCTGTGIENHAKYGEAIYYHAADSLWVNLFIPSQLTWQDKGLKVTQETSFPQTELTTLTINTAQPTQLTLLLRVPNWIAPGATVKVNGESQQASVQPDSYISLHRLWRNGDKVEYTLPMALHLHRPSDNPQMAAILYGPLVLAGDLGKEGVPADDHSGSNVDFRQVPDPPVPALSGPSGDLNTWIKAVPGQALTFTTLRAGHPKDVRLKPFCDIHHERYTVYWKFTEPDLNPQKAN